MMSRIRPHICLLDSQEEDVAVCSVNEDVVQFHICGCRCTMASTRYDMTRLAGGRWSQVHLHHESRGLELLPGRFRCDQWSSIVLRLSPSPSCSLV